MNTIEARNLKVGTKVNIWNQDFTVTGVTPSPYGDQQVYILLRDARDNGQRLRIEGYAKIQTY